MLFTWLKRYADFNGRSSRKEYWLAVLCIFLLSIAALIVDSVIFGGFKESGPVGLVVSLGTLVPSLAVSVRRMHDIDKAGWWILIGMIPLIGWAIMIWWTVRPGQASNNRFGAPPLETPGYAGVTEDVFS